ncbi:MAG: hypothetical protein QOD63_1716 [Actinomycetota bacterium]|nr:hypothetical protein [Actinomycetota bacterium]
MILYCPRCGAELSVRFRGEWFSTNAQCSECGVALAETRSMLAPSAEELLYGLDEWPVPDRVALTGALTEDGIPYRWEADVVLVVPQVAEDEVDMLLDHLEGQAPVQPTHGTVGPAASEVDGADGGEEAQAAMVDLFVAADRLWHSPRDEWMAADLAAAADAVAASLPPYGIEVRVWHSIQRMAAAAVSSVEEGAGEEAVAEGAQRLRDFLRDYV